MQHTSVPLQFTLLDVGIASDATLIEWAFYFQGSGFPLVVEPCQVMCARLMLPCKNSRLLH